MNQGVYSSERSDHARQWLRREKALLWSHSKAKCDPPPEVGKVTANSSPAFFCRVHDTSLIEGSPMESLRYGTRSTTTNPIARLQYTPAVSYLEAC